MVSNLYLPLPQSLRHELRNTPVLIIVFSLAQSAHVLSQSASATNLGGIVTLKQSSPTIVLQVDQNLVDLISEEKGAHGNQ